MGRARRRHAGAAVGGAVGRLGGHGDSGWGPRRNSPTSNPDGCGNRASRMHNRVPIDAIRSHRLRPAFMPRSWVNPDRLGGDRCQPRHPGGTTMTDAAVGVLAPSGWCRASPAVLEATCTELPARHSAELGACAGYFSVRAALRALGQITLRSRTKPSSQADPHISATTSKGTPWWTCFSNDDDHGDLDASRFLRRPH